MKPTILAELEVRGFCSAGTLSVGRLMGSQVHAVEVQRNSRRRDFIVNLGIHYLGTPRVCDLVIVNGLPLQSVYCFFRNRVSESTLPGTPESWFDSSVEKDHMKVSAVCDEVERTLMLFHDMAPTTADLCKLVHFNDDGSLVGPEWLLPWLIMGNIVREEVFAMCAAHCGNRPVVEQLRKHFWSDASEWYKSRLQQVLEDMLNPVLPP